MASEENQENSIPPENTQNCKTYEEEVIIHQDIVNMLLQCNIETYEPQVVNHLTNFMNYYVVEILNCAKTYKNHAGRDNINQADVKLAIETFAQKAPAKRLPLQELLKLAHEQNKEQLENCKGTGILIPKNDQTLSKTNYKMKNLYPQNTIRQPAVDITNRYNRMIHLNSIANQAVPSLIRTSAGTVSLNMPMNLGPQRVILKQPGPTTFNTMEENSNKRMKLDRMK